MRIATDLGARERGLYGASFDDGLLDLFCGAVLSLIGVAWIFDLVVLGPIAPALLLPFWPLARRWITEPRTGFVRFHPERAAREKRKRLGFLALGCGFLVAGIVVYFAVRGGEHRSWAHLVRGLPGLLLGVGAIVAGLVFGLARFLVYATLLMAGGGVVIHERLDPGWSIVGAGVAITLAGLILLTRFVKRHPAVTGDEPR